MDIYSCVSSSAFSYYWLLTLEVGERGADVRGLILRREYSTNGSDLCIVGQTGNVYPSKEKLCI